jgi:hypothetical protein
MVRGRLRTLLVALLAACSVAAVAAGADVPAAAATTATIEEPLEAQPFVADLGHVVATVVDGGRLTVRTQIVARPPAGWGGCIPLPSGTCTLADMRVSWFLDVRPGGSPFEQGADVKVWALPVWAKTSWVAEEWSETLGRWTTHPQQPLATTDAGGATWSLELGTLRLAAGARLLLRASSRFVPVDDVGQPLEPLYDDTATVEVPLPPVTAPPASPQPSLPGFGDGRAPPTPEQLTACNKARARVSTFDRRIRRAAKAAKSGPAARRRAARRTLRRLRSQRDAALSSKRRTCAKASQPPSR